MQLTSELGEHRAPSETLASLVEELDTDWAPDPWRWQETAAVVGDVAELVAADPLDALEVPFLGHRVRRVPLLGVSVRWALQTRVLMLADHLQSRLSPGVVAYRPSATGFEHYRQGLRRRLHVERQLAARHPIVLRVDLRSFFPSVSMQMLDAVLGDAPAWPEARALLGALEAHYGYPLAEGYSSARALANAALVPLDSVIPAPFVRWVDDYHIFCHSPEEAEDVLALVQDVAAHMGLRVASAKTGIGDSTSATRGAAVSVVGHPESGLETLAAVAAAEDPDHEGSFERAVRLALRLAVERDDDSVLDRLADWPPARVPASAVPRLGWALAQFPQAAASARLLDAVLGIDDVLTPWRALRLAPALWYMPPELTQRLLPRLLPLAHATPALAAPLSRVFARHAPGALSLLDGLVASRSWTRAWRLARREASGGMSGDGWAGPPVKSYL